MSFLSDASDAFDALANNVLPVFQAREVASADKAKTAAARDVEIANAQSLAATEAAKAKLYASLAIAGIASVALLLIIKHRR